MWVCWQVSQGSFQRIKTQHSFKSCFSEISRQVHNKQRNNSRCPEIFKKHETGQHVIRADMHCYRNKEGIVWCKLKWPKKTVFLKKSALWWDKVQSCDNHKDIRGKYSSWQVMLYCQQQHNMMLERDLQRDTEAAVEVRIFQLTAEM